MARIPLFVPDVEDNRHPRLFGADGTPYRRQIGFAATKSPTHDDLVGRGCPKPVATKIAGPRPAEAQGQVTDHTLRMINLAAWGLLAFVSLGVLATSPVTILLLSIVLLVLNLSA